jgi:ankyrin repeat protein
VDLPGASYSPLTGAIESGSIESLKLLIAAGADVNGDGYEIHPLHTATITDNVDAAKLLIDAKADVKSHRGFQESLLLAVDLGFVNMTKLYISAGADVNMYSPQLRLSCLHALATKGSPDGSLANPDLEVCDHKQIFADRINNIPCDHMGVFQVLIDAKADVSARVSGGRTALSSSARWNNIQVVNALLAAGANANDVDDNGP